MRPEEVEHLLSDMLSGTRTAGDVLKELTKLPVADIGFANLDLHRELRQGLPEAIYAEGKSPDQLVAIASRLLEGTTGPVFATRVTDEGSRALMNEFPGAEHIRIARMMVLRRAAPTTTLGTVAVVTAGTSDLPVAEEAGVTAEVMGAEVERIVDVGVAGVHRLLAVQDQLRAADVVIVVAGMEGALASLVGGIVAAPVIAVPTSVGYGASFQGLAALLAMLNSCAAGLVVTNIDNGFGAAMAAARILRSRRS
jgi:NCAIR mutase (PurE)-related protein